MSHQDSARVGEVGVFGGICAWLLRVAGWRLEFDLPDASKYVLAGGPHTSNWDFVVVMLARCASGLRFKWIGKHTLFRWPFGALMQRLGGIPVERSATKDLVQQLIEIFERHEELIVGLAPEGTRKRTEYWRTGFYYIALGAGVPIAIVSLDYSTKTLGITPGINPTGNIERDFDAIRAVLEDKRGRRPGLAGPIRPRPRPSSRQ